MEEEAASKMSLYTQIQTYIYQHNGKRGLWNYFVKCRI